VAAAFGGANSSLKKVRKRVATLDKGQDEIRGQNAELKKDVTALTQDVEAIEEEANAINRKIRQLSANGGT
jgi:chromosome segregation ATPase